MIYVQFLIQNQIVLVIFLFLRHMQNYMEIALHVYLSKGNAEMMMVI